MPTLHRHIADRIRERCRARKWSQNQLADFAGIGRGHLSKILSLKQSPTLRTLEKIADALEVSVRDLLPSPK